MSVASTKWRVQKRSLFDQWADTCFVVTCDDSEEEFTYYCNMIANVPHPPFCGDQRRHDWLVANTRLRPGDMVVCTYPKCGTTWMEQIVLLILNKGDASLLDPLSKNSMNSETAKGVGKVWLEPTVFPADGIEESPSGWAGKMTLEQFDAVPSPRLIKSHAPRQLFLGAGVAGAWPEGVKVIYVARNPMDAAVSMFYHGPNPHRQGWPFEAWAQCWLQGGVEFGSWCEHVKGWRREWESQQRPEGKRQLMWAQFESMKMTPEDAVRQVAAFIGVEVTDEQLAKVVQHSSFDAMKAVAQQTEKDLEEKQQKQSDSHPEQGNGKGSKGKGKGESGKGGKGKAGKSGHLRKGKVGDWRNHFLNQHERETFLQGLREQMAGTCISFDIGEGETLEFQ